MAARQKTSVSLDPDILKLVKKAVVDPGLNVSDAVEQGLKLWLTAQTHPEKAYNSTQIDDISDEARILGNAFHHGDPLLRKQLDEVVKSWRNRKVEVSSGSEETARKSPRRRIAG